MVHTCPAQDVDDNTCGAVYEHINNGQNYCLVCYRTEEEAEQTIPTNLGEDWWRCHYDIDFMGDETRTCSGANFSDSDECRLCGEEREE